MEDIVKVSALQTAVHAARTAASASDPIVVASTEPNDRGAMTRRHFDSYYKVGQYQRFAGAEREPVGTCHLACEHASVDAQGYLEGAVESGARAAREVLAGVGLVPR